MMPRLQWIDSQLVLSFEDDSIAQNSDIKLFLGSILDMNFDGSQSYIYSKTNDFVKSAFLIQRISNYIQTIGLQCQLDKQSEEIISSLKNSEAELQDSVRKGLEIKNKPQPITPIPGFTRTLKPYQVAPAKHAVESLYAANFSVPGSGKTTIAYASFALLKAQGIVDKIMVIGPRSSFMPWEEEYEGCFGRKPTSYRVVGGQEDLEDKVANNELTLLTYQMASGISSQLISVLCKNRFLLILDESHHIKRFTGGIWSTSVLKIAPYAKRRLILTGTPMPHSLLDLWSQFTFLWPFRNLLGERLAYRGIAESREGLERVKGMIHPFYTRITKRELNLPDPLFKPIEVPLNRIQKAIYAALEAKTLADLGEISIKDKAQLRQWRQNKIIRLLQAASNPSLLTEYSEEFRIPPLSIEGLSVVRLIENYSQHEIPSKLVETTRITKELFEKGEKVLIWTTFVHNIRTLEANLGKILDTVPIVICGEIPKDDNENESYNREKSIKEFKNDPNPRVLIANPNSLAESVSLHKVCRNAIYVDRTFNAGQFIQSLDRIHRVGLAPDQIVTYHILMSKETIDVVINDRLNEKYTRMLNVLNDDVTVIDLDTDIMEISDEEFDRDFQAVHKYLLNSQKTGE
jgi:SNF2 family DNA or RNA helicase